jgi:hypothetical protein
VIPTYDNPATVRHVVEAVRAHLADDRARRRRQRPGRTRRRRRDRSAGLARVERRARNGGKGAAVKTGFAAAQQLGPPTCCRSTPIGQHDLGDVPRFLAEARAPTRRVDPGSPRVRRDAARARALSRARSASSGCTSRRAAARSPTPVRAFRVYPLAAALAADARGDHMEFDLELPVRLVWAGTPRAQPAHARALPHGRGGRRLPLRTACATTDASRGCTPRLALPAGSARAPSG